jgi:hypothetical protein
LSPFGFSFNERNKTPPLAGFIDHAVCHAPQQSLWPGFAALCGALKAWRGGESLRGRIPFFGEKSLSFSHNRTFDIPFPFLCWTGRKSKPSRGQFIVYRPAFGFPGRLAFLGSPQGSLAPRKVPRLPLASRKVPRLSARPLASRKAPLAPKASPGSQGFPWLPARLPARQGPLSLFPRRLSLAGSVRGALACFVVSKPAAPGGWP